MNENKCSKSNDKIKDTKSLIGHAWLKQIYNKKDKKCLNLYFRFRSSRAK